ncbi:unnamed protein product [Meloidogyne enterolobii]|uniref:Uncharacterized protein n=2 Tax=Meloidogyne enterolobii TaxID=390850 RepID=A0A6V7VEN9_MELEN|nr:unnamed protein product [Meloidogyne enterolobii]
MESSAETSESEVQIDKLPAKKIRKLRPPPPPLRTRLKEDGKLDDENLGDISRDYSQEELANMRAESERLSLLVDESYFLTKPFGARFLRPYKQKQKKNE